MSSSVMVALSGLTAVGSCEANPRPVLQSTFELLRQKRSIEAL